MTPGPMSLLRIRVSADRDRCGAIDLVDGAGRCVLGAFAVAARASDAAAVHGDNPRRLRTHRFGDTPTGRFRITAIARTGSGTPYPANRYGPGDIVVLEPILGEALLAEALRPYP